MDVDQTYSNLIYGLLEHYGIFSFNENLILQSPLIAFIWASLIITWTFVAFYDVNIQTNNTK
jgi:hypothetical protein